jgi:hypothetical protein
MINKESQIQIGKRLYTIKDKSLLKCLRCKGTGKIKMMSSEGSKETDCPHCVTTNGVTKAYLNGKRTKG